METLKLLWQKLKSTKNFEILVAILIIAIILSIYISSITKPKSPIEDELYQTPNESRLINNTESEINSTKEELERILSSIKGVGKVEVMITYKTGKELVTAINTIKSDTITEEQDNAGGIRKTTQTNINNQPVTMNDSSGTKPLILKEVEPEIKGVLVIAEGANNIKIRLELLRAVKTALGIHSNQVEVFEMG